MNKQELLSKISESKLKEENLLIDQWQETVTIRELDGKKYIEVATKCSDSRGNVDNDLFFNYAIIKSVYLNDEQLFENSDLQLVSSLPADIYSKFVTSITRLNNINQNGVNGVNNSKN